MSNLYTELERTLRQSGAERAIEQLIDSLQNRNEYGPLFYAHLLKSRHGLGVSPIPSEPGSDLPEHHHAAYEEAIREAARSVGRLYLQVGDIPAAWNYFRLINEPGPIREAFDKLYLEENAETYPLVDIAFHQNVHPRRGFDLVLDRQGICSAITLVTSFESAMAEDLRVYCVERLVRALYGQLHERLRAIVADSEGAAPSVEAPLDELLTGRDWLFEGDAWHIDQSHLNSVVHLSIHLPRGEELELARALCRYGVKLPENLRGKGDPPFEDVYRDFGLYLQAVAGDDVETALAHFRKKAQRVDPEGTTAPAEVLVNLLLKCGRPDEALAAAKRHLIRADDRQLRCPGPLELSRRLGRFDEFAEVARLRGDAVQFLAGLLADAKARQKPAATS
jgi:hypothetical protein